jgi:alkylation response protein AidB-like acyl-CoA dehydrogenase
MLFGIFFIGISSIGSARAALDEAILAWAKTRSFFGKH